ncbi:TadE/TadG family type IV pilus assembly protein, partial [Bordetella pertussis]
MVLYGGLTWAFIFAAQQSLNHAAEEGARAA